MEDFVKMVIGGSTKKQKVNKKINQRPTWFQPGENIGVPEQHVEGGFVALTEQVDSQVDKETMHKNSIQ